MTINQWLKIIEKYPLTVLEIGSPKSISWAVFPLKTLREQSIPPCLSQLPLVAGKPWPSWFMTLTAVSVLLTHNLLLSVSIASHGLLTRVLVIGFRTTLLQ